MKKALSLFFLILIFSGCTSSNLANQPTSEETTAKPNVVTTNTTTTVNTTTTQKPTTRILTTTKKRTTTAKPTTKKTTILKASSISISGSNFLRVGEFVFVSASVLPFEVFVNTTFTWKTSSPCVKIHTFSNRSFVHIQGISPGSATITATTQYGLSKSLNMTIAEYN